MPGCSKRGNPTALCHNSSVLMLQSSGQDQQHCSTAPCVPGDFRPHRFCTPVKMAHPLGASSTARCIALGQAPALHIALQTTKAFGRTAAGAWLQTSFPAADQHRRPAAYGLATCRPVHQSWQGQHSSPCLSGSELIVLLAWRCSVHQAQHAWCTPTCDFGVRLCGGVALQQALPAVVAHGCLHQEQLEAVACDSVSLNGPV